MAALTREGDLFNGYFHMKTTVSIASALASHGAKRFVTLLCLYSFLIFWCTDCLRHNDATLPESF